MTTVRLEYTLHEGTWHELLNQVKVMSPQYAYGELAWTWSAYQGIIQAMEQNAADRPLPGVFLRAWDSKLVPQLERVTVAELLAFGRPEEPFWRIVRRSGDRFLGIQITETTAGDLDREEHLVQVWEQDGDTRRFPFAARIGGLEYPPGLVGNLWMVTYVRDGVLIDWRLCVHTQGKEGR